MANIFKLHGAGCIFWQLITSFSLHNQFHPSPKTVSTCIKLNVLGARKTIHNSNHYLKIHAISNNYNYTLKVI